MMRVRHSQSSVFFSNRGEMALLNDDCVREILALIGPKDLARAAQVCRQWRFVVDNCDGLWRQHCRDEWLFEGDTPKSAVVTNNSSSNSSRSDDGVVTWRQRYMHEHRRWARYGAAYKVVKGAWTQLERFLQRHSHAVYSSLRRGASEQEIDLAEDRLGLVLPLDLRLSYRIHDGQQQASDWDGLFGSSIVYDMRLCQGLVPLARLRRSGSTVQFAQQEPETSLRTNIVCRALASDVQPAMKEGTVIMPSSARPPTSNFLLAPSFAVFFQDFVHKAVNGHHAIATDGRASLDRHLFSGPTPSFDGIIHGSEAVTNGVRIQVSTCFNGEISSVGPAQSVLHFSYRILISMDSGPHRPVQLVSRHWRIQTSEGVVPVDGPGVVGYFPILTPGMQPFVYASRTSAPYTQTLNNVPAELREHSTSTLFLDHDPEGDWHELLEGSSRRRREQGRAQTRWSVPMATSVRPSALVSLMHGSFTFKYLDPSRPHNEMRSPNQNPDDLSGDFDAIVAPFRLVCPAVLTVGELR